MKLPEMAVLLIRLIGTDAALRMMKPAHYGGKTYLVPKNEVGRGEQSFAALAEIVGMNNARIISRHFGGGKIYVPLLDKMALLERNRAIVTAYGSGVSVWQLATDHGLSDRHIYKILSETDMNDSREVILQQAQESLF